MQAVPEKEGWYFGMRKHYCDQCAAECTDGGDRWDEEIFLEGKTPVRVVIEVRSQGIIGGQPAALDLCAPCCRKAVIQAMGK